MLGGWDCTEKFVGGGELMGFISGTYWNMDYNKMRMIQPQSLAYFEPALSKKQSYVVALDQSTTCTGIAVADTEFKFFVILDVINDCISKESYFNELHQLLRKMFRDVDVRLLIHEKPVPSKYGYTASILQTFVGRLREWLANEDDFNIGNIVSIYPQEWKSYIVNSSKGGGMKRGKKVQRGYVKSLVAEDVCDIYPLANAYRKVTPSKDYDSFDALGILTGYVRYAYTDEGIPKICGQEEKTHVSLVSFMYLPESALEDVNVLIQPLGGCAENLKPQYKVYNPKYNLHTNIRKATSNCKSTITILPDSEIPVLQMEFGFKTIPNGKMVMYAFKKGALRKSEEEKIRKSFPMTKEVYPIR